VMAGLNPTEVQEIIPVISSIRDSGVTIIIIEHIMEVIMTLSDRIVVIHHGEKIAEGTPNEIANNEEVIKAYFGEAVAHA
jgi:branched-chain amino acid transport system ATP-binding protein